MRGVVLSLDYCVFVVTHRLGGWLTRYPSIFVWRIGWGLEDDSSAGYLSIA